MINTYNRLFNSKSCFIDVIKLIIIFLALITTYNIFESIRKTFEPFHKVFTYIELINDVNYNIAMLGSILTLLFYTIYYLIKTYYKSDKDLIHTFFVTSFIIVFFSTNIFIQKLIVTENMNKENNQDLNITQIQNKIKDLETIIKKQ